MQKQTMPILLFNDECAVCRRIGHWVQRSAQISPGETANATSDDIAIASLEVAKTADLLFGETA